MKKLILTCLCLCAALIALPVLPASADEISSFIERIGAAESYFVQFNSWGEDYGEPGQGTGTLFYVKPDFVWMDMVLSYGNSKQTTHIGISRDGFQVVLYQDSDVMVMNLQEAFEMGCKEAIENPLYLLLTDENTSSVAVNGNVLTIEKSDKDHYSFWLAEIKSLQ